MPRYTVRYSQSPAIPNAKVEKMDTSNIPNLPSQGDDAWQWVDLDGDSAPGILEQRHGGAWVFRRNENGIIGKGSSPQFERHVIVQSLPNRQSGKGAYFEDLNQDGTLELVCLDRNDKIEGFFH